SVVFAPSPYPLPHGAAFCMIAVSPSVLGGVEDQLGLGPASDAVEAADPAGQVVQAHAAGGQAGEGPLDPGPLSVHRGPEPVAEGLEHVDRVQPGPVAGPSVDGAGGVLAGRDQLQ